MNDLLTRDGPSTVETVVIIPRGASVGSIATILTEAGVLQGGDPFSIGVRFFSGNKPLRAGEFAFPAGVSARDTINILQSGEAIARRITIPEGLTTAQALAIVGGAEGLTGELGATLREGELLPETYHFSFGDSRADIVARMRNAMEGALADMWPTRARGLPFAVPDEAIILASIVEKETGLPQERAMVAAVFINRLKINMPLQADPTVRYALTRGTSPLDRPLSRKDLEVDDPYNTYRYPGLPPGPIANPGRDSIAAVLNPAVTNALYFVADGNGGHAFAENLNDHNRNVQRYRQQQRIQATNSGNANDEGSEPTVAPEN